MTSSCDNCVIRRHAICASLNPGELDALDKIGRKRTIPRGQTILWEGDEALLVANVIEGVLKLSTSTGDGREQIVGVVYPSDFIGRPFGQNSGHSVTALSDARVCLFPRSAFDSFTREHPDLEHKLLQRTLDELDRARRWMLLLGRKTAAERVASLIIEMSERLSAPGKGPLDIFDLPLSRQQMADVLGLTIETVSRQLTKLKGSGMITLPSARGIEIVDRERLKSLADVT